jgi:hypothetical protein
MGRMISPQGREHDGTGRACEYAGCRPKIEKVNCHCGKFSWPQGAVRGGGIPEEAEHHSVTGCRPEKDAPEYRITVRFSLENGWSALVEGPDGFTKGSYTHASSGSAKNAAELIACQHARTQQPPEVYKFTPEI